MKSTGAQEIYLVELKPRAVKDLKGLPTLEAKTIVERVKNLEQGLVRDIKKLTSFEDSPTNN
jgi:hypothetical protein